VPSVITLPAASKAPMRCCPTLYCSHRAELETVSEDSQLPSACCTKSAATVVVLPALPSISAVTSVEPAKDADNWMASLTSTAGAEQLKLDGSMVVTLSEDGVGVGSGVGLANMTNVKDVCASTWPLESRRLAVWTPGPIEQLVEPSGLSVLTDQVPSGCFVRPKAVAACVLMVVPSIW
jgi:hypothetical protein